MKAKEFSAKTAQELQQLAQEMQAKLRVARFQGATRQLKNTSSTRAVQRDLARVLTAQATQSRSHS